MSQGNRPQEDLIKARKQLIIVGVVCITAVVLALWLISLPRTLARNRAQYSSPSAAFKQLQELWKK